MFQINGVLLNRNQIKGKQKDIFVYPKKECVSDNELEFAHWRVELKQQQTSSL